MKPIWIDCDPGHDDAIALLLGVHSPAVKLLGVSTVHGNAPASCTWNNALRLLYAFGAPEDIHVYPGATKPLLRPARADPEIHGEDGLGGVEGLPNVQHWAIQDRLFRGGETRAIEGMANAIRQTWQKGRGQKVSFITSGPMTNLALFVSVYPDLVDGIEEIVSMGGGVGLGNRGAVAEYNILCDPEAAQIVLDVPVRKVLIPINVTHTAIVTASVYSRLLSTQDSSSNKARTPLRHTLSTLISFFAESYKSTFGFNDGPPLHDALTVAYISRPELFVTKRYRVDVELAGTHTTGETVVDIWNYRTTDDSWGPTGKNCMVAEYLNVDGFFELFLDCVSRCDQVSPLNRDH